MKRNLQALAFGGASLLAAAIVSVAPLNAADHVEAPGSQADAAADITDFYAWHDATERTLTAVVNVAGLSPSGTPAVYDRDVVYVVHIDNDGDHVSDREVLARFGPDSDGAWGLKVENLPGADGDLVGDVETTIVRNGTRAFAGLRDDPFFFDLDGYTDTITNGALLDGGNLYFDPTRDSFAGTNVTSIVIEMDLDEALDGGATLNLWASTARI